MNVNLDWLKERIVSNAAVKQIIVTQSNNRLRLAHTKVRSEVNRSNRKTLRQKGSGKARQGSAGAPIRIGGGQAHGPRFHIVDVKNNRKLKTAVRLDVLRRHYEKNNIIISDINITKPSTKDAVAILKNLQLQGRIVIIINGYDDNIKLSFRNIPYIIIENVYSLNTINLVNAHKILMTSDAANKLPEIYGVTCQE